MKTGFLLLLLGAGATAHGGGEIDGLRIHKDLLLRELVAWYAHRTDRIVLVDDPKILERKIGAGMVRGDLTTFTRAVLAFYEVAVERIPGVEVDVLRSVRGPDTGRFRLPGLRAWITLRRTRGKIAVTPETHRCLLATATGAGGAALRATAVRLLALAPRDTQTAQALFLAVTDPDPRVRRAAWSVPAPFFTTD